MVHRRKKMKATTASQLTTASDTQHKHIRAMNPTTALTMDLFRIILVVLVWLVGRLLIIQDSYNRDLCIYIYIYSYIYPEWMYYTSRPLGHGGDTR